MYNGVAIHHELLQGERVGQIALNEDYTEGGKRGSFDGVSDQCAYPKTLFQQALAQAGTDKTCSAGNGDQAAVEDQAEATLRRTSSAAASSLSMSLALMKSSRAFARDSLPDDVRGRE